MFYFFQMQKAGNRNRQAVEPGAKHRLYFFNGVAHAVGDSDMERLLRIGPQIDLPACGGVDHIRTIPPQTGE